ncbi:MAG: flavodoxin family protein, partial [Bacilli bacterium]
MKIGIVVYSYTGNTFLVSQILASKLEENHFDVTIERLETYQNEEMDPQKVTLNNHLLLSKYDVLVFASPIRGFSLAAPFKKFLTNDFQETDKKVFGFVTQFLSFNWCGPNQAKMTLQVVLNHKNCDFTVLGSIKWKI